MAKELPRGIRNKNPLNIRIGNTWLGEVKEPTDDQFEQFISMAYGCRAAFVILRRYIRRYKRTTIRKIVSSWAPASENNVSAYVNDVVKRTGLGADQEIHYSDQKTMCALVMAMAYHENGQPISADDVLKGYKMA